VWAERYAKECLQAPNQIRGTRRGEVGNDGQEGIDKPSAAFEAFARVFKLILERDEYIT
jgi:hypothetical protein